MNRRLLPMIALALLLALAGSLSAHTAFAMPALQETSTSDSDNDAEEDTEEDVELATASASTTLVQDGRAIVHARGNHFVVDSVPPLGGPNEERNPMDLFLGALATCGIFVYEAAAAEMDIPLDSITVTVEADFAPKGLVDGSVNPRVRAFRAMVNMEGPTDEQAEALAEQWRLRCPIYTTLELAAPIDIIHVGDEMADGEVDEMAGEVRELALVTHIQAGAAEQDVHFINDDGQAVRVDPEMAEGEGVLEQEVFGTATPVEHDPFMVNENPLGPYEAGEPLGFTMAEWLAGTGSGVYTVDGDTASVEMNFESLRPDATYTLWCSQFVLPPNFEIRNAPCGAEDGSENVFMTDENGAGDIAVNLLQPMPASDDEHLSLFAISYHSDGQSWGASPGDFSVNSHVQLFVPLPAPEGE